MTRRFDIGPIVLGLGAIVLLVGLFLAWYGDRSAWESFELADLLLAVLALAAIACAVGLLTPDADLLDGRALPWVVAAALVVVVVQMINPPPGFGGEELGIGAWLSFGGTLAMVLGAVLALSRISFAVAVEGRDRRRRVSAVDHRPPPTETGAPVSRTTSLLNPDTPEHGTGG